MSEKTGLPKIKVTLEYSYTEALVQLQIFKALLPVMENVAGADTDSIMQMKSAIKQLEDQLATVKPEAQKSLS